MMVTINRTDVLESDTVETVKQMQDALGAKQGPGRDDRHLADTYVVELVAHTMSDGTERQEVRVRKASRQV
jgi:hypothetical protein